MPLLVILAILFLILLLAVLSKSDRLARFWSFPTKQTPNKYPTLEDTRRKYPKRFSQEQLRKQAMAKEAAESMRKKEIIDRNIREVRDSQSATTQKREISISSFRRLVKMVHGHEDVARRLIEGNLKLFPDKDPTWACDKAIEDLLRDRQ